MNDFEKYYNDDLERIELHGAVFHVKLPTTDNKRFQRAVLAAVTDLDVDSDDPELVLRKTDVAEMAEIQVEAFVKTCIRRVEGWDDYSVLRLLAMPDACEDIWTAVLDIAKARQAEADAAAKKSEPISSGQASGPEKNSSTKDLKTAAG